MIKAICLILLQVFLFPLGCSANKADVIDEKAIQTVIKYYFSDKAKVDFESQPYFLSGDFNGDGIDDIAILF